MGSYANTGYLLILPKCCEDCSASRRQKVEDKYLVDGQIIRSVTIVYVGNNNCFLNLIGMKRRVTMVEKEDQILKTSIFGSCCMGNTLYLKLLGW